MYFGVWLVVLMVKNLLQCRRLRFIPWFRKIPWRREQLPTPVFLPGEMHGQRSLAGYSPWSLKESDTTVGLKHKAQSILKKKKDNFIWIMKFHCFQQGRYMVSLKPWLYKDSAALSRLPGMLLIKSCLIFHPVYFEPISDNCADHAVYVSWLQPI